MQTRAPIPDDIDVLKALVADLGVEMRALRSEREPAAQAPAAAARPAPQRRPLPEHLPRDIEQHLPQEAACPDCSGAWKQLGEDVSEVLEFVPTSFKVVRHVRPSLACTCCDRMAQAPAPSRPIARSYAGPGLLAHVFVSTASAASMNARAWSSARTPWPTESAPGISCCDR